jgi:3-dehydroquinate synthase
LTWRTDVCCASRQSVIVGGEGALDSLRPRAADLACAGSRLFVITDSNVKAHWGDPVLALLGSAAGDARVLTLPPGEQTKSFANAEACCEWLAQTGARRDDLVVALGGGVVGDLAGFVASTYLRGVALWQLPTSLLAQVDSSVGGKTGVNLSAGKNLVGSFYQPDVVVADPAVLSSLPEADYTNGLGEVVKYGLLDEAGLFTYLEKEAEAVLTRDRGVLSHLVQRCVGYKVYVVEKDEREEGLRVVLNLGHTTAHALEVTLGYGTLPHGQAVALGLLVALRVSEEMFQLEPSVRERTVALLTRFSLPTSIDLPSVDDLLQASRKDKKVRAATRGFVCLNAIGQPLWAVDVPDDVVRQALEVIRR